jgi:hypothetical protein
VLLGERQLLRLARGPVQAQVRLAEAGVREGVARIALEREVEELDRTLEVARLLVALERGAAFGAGP